MASRPDEVHVPEEVWGPNSFHFADHDSQGLRDKTPFTLPAGVALLLMAALLTFAIVLLAVVPHPAVITICSLIIVFVFVSLFGLRTVPPTTAVVLQLCGKYIGTMSTPGWWWNNPFSYGTSISLRLRNFESSRLKVNERDGSPIEIAAIVVWRVVNSVEAAFMVESYETFVRIQTESALREMASTFPYDSHAPNELSLRTSSNDVARRLKDEIEKRLTRAGMEVVEARISHLAYAQEIASAMLQRQQASAIVAARTKIVEGAVSIVQMALDELAQKRIANLDEAAKSSLVSNLLTVLCSERPAQPVVSL